MGLLFSIDEPGVYALYFSVGILTDSRLPAFCSMQASTEHGLQPLPGNLITVRLEVEGNGPSYCFEAPAARASS